MKIVIDIDENVFTRLFDNGTEDYEIVNDDLFAIAKSIRKGTPLPKHHGRLIECEPIYDKLTQSYRADEKDHPERGKDYRVGLSNAIDLLIKAPTIIEGSDSE